ncbi:hypothetical protein HRM2_12100 [Desulforapulum autotrophicum HRM2]|uniref:DUF106 domain-containing protein n=1 Tax=Desulforapulum autotrophicum (strain ATCC 43914 / DSM 3382 / VKM B-1955 / HRM2) TaxID=177437 RepID=C0QM16_DESAH|nr:hypothetical protein [Desulforapulum autotrophicum]ACN14322.1 hypothetical protein HRM2_12100 [Desulforapulum autotrophicum HRM2]
MDAFLDTLWDQILILSLKTAALLDILLSPLSFLGPVVIIFLLALAAVGVSAFLSAVYSTKRHQHLEKEFKYWFDLRQEATNHPETDKGKAMAKNIDQAKLNRAYYDYFFEGLMKSLLTTWLPIFTILAYVNLSYNPEALGKKFGSETLFVIGTLKASAIFWYVVSLVVSFVIVGITKHLYKKRKP